MAHISSIGDNHSTCLVFENIDNAMDIIKTLLRDEEQAEENVGQYAIMVSLEEHNVRLDIVTTFDDDPVVFGTAYQVGQEMRKEILGEEDET